jgi:hypothetical protein
MSDIRADATVFIFFEPQQGRRFWVADTDSRRDRFGNLMLIPILDDEARFAKSWRYDLAQIAARRFNTEGAVITSGHRAKFSLQASDSSQAIDSEVTPIQREDQRVPMHYKGLLAVPGRDTRTGEECWWVRFPGTTIESIRGATPEEAVDKAFERNLQHQAEQYEAPPAQQAPPQKHRFGPGIKIRPGALRNG